MRTAVMLGCGALCCCTVMVAADDQSSRTTFRAEVTEIIDGDTIEVVNATGTKIRVRLHAIDAPEKGQPYAKQAAAKLSQKVEGKQVNVIVRKVIKQDVLSANVSIPSATPLLPPESVNTTCVKRGWAWHDIHADPEVDWLKDYQAIAQQKRLGLWDAAKKPTPPWQYRKENRPAPQQDQLK